MKRIVWACVVGSLCVALWAAFSLAVTEGEETGAVRDCQDNVITVAVESNDSHTWLRVRCHDKSGTNRVELNLSRDEASRLSDLLDQAERRM